MPLTGSTIRTALASIGAVGKQITGFDDLAAGASAALRRAPGLTVEGAAAFLATCAQESAYFRTTTEYGSGHRYAPYIGRTFTQITWEANYRDFGRWCKTLGLVTDSETFVRNPKSLGELRWAWLGPIQYWEENGIWRWANAGDFRAVSQAINGGNGRVGTSFTPHGWKERQAMYAAFRKAGAALLPSGTSAPPTSSGGTYTIRAGDTLSGIASRYPGVTWRAIADTNALADPDRLQLGQVLRIPGGTPATAAPAPAPALEEDTLPDVADVWSHPIEDLFTPQGGDVMPAFAALGWAAAHAANARNAASQALAEIAGLRTAVDRLAAAVGTTQDVDPIALQQAVRDGVAQALAESVQVTGQLDVAPRP